jgi:iron(III) transport system substrate-binding protein
MSPHRSPRHRAIRLAWTLLAITAAALVAAGCGSDESDASSGSDDAAAADVTLVVYSGREQELVEPLYEQFTEETGIELDVRYGESPAMAAQLLEEGDQSPADVFYAQDAGAIGVASDLLAELPEETLSLVEERFRDGDGHWVGVTGRARALVYNTEEVEADTLPGSILEVVEPAWKDKVGVAPTNASFVAWVTAMRITEGDDAAREFLEGLVANGARTYEKNGAIVDAVANGEVTVGLVNHYYLYEKLAQDAELPIANHFYDDGDIGNLVNVSAVGVLDSSTQQDAAKRFVEFMLDEGQRFITEVADAREFPVIELEGFEDSERYADLPDLAEIRGPEVDLGDLAPEFEATVAMIEDAGLTS